MSYIGNEPIVSATRTITEVTATAGQTVFTANGGYTVGYIDVFLNGAQLQTVDFTATNGTTITLTEAAQVGDVIRLVAWGTFSTSTSVARAGDTMTGALLLPDGSASAPALSNDGDNNTGMFFPAADTIAFAEGGVESARFDSSGNLGIGTTSPAERLHVNGGDVRIQAFIPELKFVSEGAVNRWYIGANISDSVNGDLIFGAGTGVGNNERMRITADGLFQFNSGYGSVATAYGCRAWVNFNGTGTVAIRASGNVSSITDNGTADYTVNFATAMVDTSYTYAYGCNNVNNDFGVNATVLNAPNGGRGTGSLRVLAMNVFSGGANYSSDTSSVTIAFFR